MTMKVTRIPWAARLKPETVQLIKSEAAAKDTSQAKVVDAAVKAHLGQKSIDLSRFPIHGVSDKQLVKLVAQHATKPTKATP